MLNLTRLLSKLKKCHLSAEVFVVYLFIVFIIQVLNNLGKSIKIEIEKYIIIMADM